MPDIFRHFLFEKLSAETFLNVPNERALCASRVHETCWDAPIHMHSTITPNSFVLVQPSLVHYYDYILRPWGADLLHDESFIMAILQNLQTAERNRRVNISFQLIADREFFRRVSAHAKKIISFHRCAESFPREGGNYWRKLLFIFYSHHVQRSVACCFL